MSSVFGVIWNDSNDPLEILYGGLINWALTYIKKAIFMWPDEGNIWITWRWVGDIFLNCYDYCSAKNIFSICLSKVVEVWIFSFSFTFTAKFVLQTVVWQDDLVCTLWPSSQPTHSSIKPSMLNFLQKSQKISDHCFYTKAYITWMNCSCGNLPIVELPHPAPFLCSDLPSPLPSPPPPSPFACLLPHPNPAQLTWNQVWSELLHSQINLYWCTLQDSTNAPFGAFSFQNFVLSFSVVRIPPPADRCLLHRPVAPLACSPGNRCLLRCLLHNWTGFPLRLVLCACCDRWWRRRRSWWAWRRWSWTSWRTRRAWTALLPRGSILRSASTWTR